MTVKFVSLKLNSIKGALLEYEMIQMIFKTRFSNEGSGKNAFSRFENNNPASDDYQKNDPSWTLDDCVSHFAKRTPDRGLSASQRVRRADSIYYLTRRTPKYQYKSSNRTSYYEKTNRTISSRQGIIQCKMALFPDDIAR